MRQNLLRRSSMQLWKAVLPASAIRQSSGRDRLAIGNVVTTRARVKGESCEEAVDPLPIGADNESPIPFDSFPTCERMSNWFSKTKRRKKNAVRKAPQPFDLECCCGEFIEVLRRERFQRVLCQQCGESHFILPLDCYPPPAPPEVDRPSPTDSEETKKSTPKQTQKNVPVKQAPEPPAEPALLPRRRKRILSPFRVVALSVAAAIGVTLYLAMHFRQVDRAAITYKDKSEAGYQALTKGDFGAAASAFAEAAAALDLLEQEDEAARQVRQMLRESRAAAELPASNLESIIREITQSETPQETLESRFADRWLIFDTWLYPPPKQESHLYLDMPILHEEQRVTLRIAPSALPGVVSNAATHVVFAAQLADCTPPAKEHSEWLLDLNGETAFLWTGIESSRHLGLLPNQDAEAAEFRVLLRHQSDLLGLQPSDNRPPRRGETGGE